MAARVGDALGGLDPGALILGQFRQAEGPRRIDAMRGGGVDHTGVRVVDQRDRFLGRFVRQAQESHVGSIDQALALGQILALVGVDLEHFDIAALGEVFVDLQAGGAFLAVDKDFVGHGVSAEWVERLNSGRKV